MMTDFVDIDVERINRTVHGALREAMRDLDERLEGLKDLPFAVAGCRHGPEGSREDRRHGPDSPRAERHREFRERRDMRDTLKALERGEISVDEAMDRLDG
jgi:hypothetical protein